MNSIRSSIRFLRRWPWLLLGAAGAAFAAGADTDPVHTDGDKYAVRFENDRVRVLEYRDEPGATTRPHAHPAFVLLALSPFERRLLLDGGKAIDRHFAAGDVMFSEAQVHAGRNTGNTPTRVLMVELKPGACDVGAR